MIDEKVRIKGKLPNGAIQNKEIHRRWQVMRRRCYDPDFNVYRYYGGKGIGICKEWRTNYLAFQSWALENGWKPGLTIDRINSSKGYSPDNCRWATMREQAMNRPTFNVLVTVNGVTKSITEWADYLGIDRTTITCRVSKYGWNPVKAVTEPVNRTRKGKKNV